jgi:glutaminase
VNSGRPGKAPLGQPFVSTGRLPSPELVKSLVSECYERFKSNNDGRNSDVYPALADVPQDLFGLCVVGVNGSVYASGDWDYPLSVMSVSKPFVFTLVCQVLGGDVARQRLGVNATGLPFNSLAAVERSEDGRTNPMVNWGAIATTSLAPGSTLDEKWMFILDGLSRFAGRALSMNADVFASAAESNSRNQAIGQLLQSCGRLPIETHDAIDLYTRQCSLNVSAKDLGVMGATLADGGVNPLTKQRVIDAESCKFTLAVMATAGLYETSGDWLYEVGLPGKSGIGGGIVTVSPARADSAHSLRGSTTPATASRDSWPRNTFRSASASACLLRRRKREVRERLSDQALPADLSR